MCNILHTEETCDQCGRIISRTSQRMNCLEKRVLNNKFRDNWHVTMAYYCPNGEIEEDYKPVSVDQCKQCWSDSRDITQGKDMPCHQQPQDGEQYRKSCTPGSESHAIQMTLDIQKSLQAQHPPLPRDAEIYPPPVSESARANMPRRWTRVHKDKNKKKDDAPLNGEGISREGSTDETATNKGSTEGGSTPTVDGSTASDSTSSDQASDDTTYGGSTDEGPTREGPVGPSRLIVQLGGYLVDAVSELLTPQESPY
ncbi:hypothetical protein CkaCkLH20_03014 [Colletotrichum karsti]|uniref:Uncharacterized protein n=1 Tax=Colletotrichum karsti TaxID=1095194 RepID=A0A9P6IF99_9PEZI|nr:uncharacterized protein CkaCkLH20_03014 [Colletotrichum karsti]KAF9879471.1 hypothetical protein CkaCkLH20_03014 [Colletotrichum karsti]